MPSSKNDIVSELLKADSNGTLLVPKHDPDELHVTWDKFRSVVSYEIAQNMTSFLAGGDFTVKLYYNTEYSNTPDLVTITPAASSTFTVPGSAVPAFSTTPNVAYDTFVAVNGLSSGWHVMAEDSRRLSQRITSGKLIFKQDLT